MELEYICKEYFKLNCTYLNSWKVQHIIHHTKIKIKSAMKGRNYHSQSDDYNFFDESMNNAWHEEHS